MSDGMQLDGDGHDPQSAAEREAHAQTIAALAMRAHDGGHGHGQAGHSQSHGHGHGHGHAHAGPQHAYDDAGDITMGSGVGDGDDDDHGGADGHGDAGAEGADGADADESAYGAASFMHINHLTDLDMDALGNEVGVGVGLGISPGVGESEDGGAGSGSGTVGDAHAHGHGHGHGHADGDGDGDDKMLDGQLLTEEEIRRKQNRSRAGGRVLPVGRARGDAQPGADGAAVLGGFHGQRGAACGASGLVDSFWRAGSRLTSRLWLRYRILQAPETAV